MFKSISFLSNSLILGAFTLTVTSFEASAAKMGLEVATDQKSQQKVYTLVLEDVCNAGAVKVRSIKSDGENSDYQKFNGSEALLFVDLIKNSKSNSCKKMTISLPTELIRQGQNLQVSTYVFDEVQKKPTLRRDVRHLAIPCTQDIVNMVGIRTYPMDFDFQKAPVCASPANKPVTAPVKPAMPTPIANPTPVQPVKKEASLKLVFSGNSDDTVRYALAGADLCEAEGLRFRVIDNLSDTKTAWYMSKGDEPKDTFDIPKTCSFNMNLSPNYILPGKILQVKTVKRKDPRSVELVDVENFYVEVPCLSDIEMALDRKREYSLDTLDPRSKVVKPTKCLSAKTSNTQTGVGGAGVQAEKQEPQQSCQASITEAANSTVVFSASCSLAEEADVVVKQNEEIVFNQRRYLGPNRTTLTDTYNPRASTVVYRMEIMSVKTGEKMDSKRLTLLKKPSFSLDHIASGQYLSPTTLKPARDTSWGDYVWDAEIKVRVTDGDLEENVGDEQILVQLINIDSGKTVLEQTVATGEEVKFKLRAEYYNAWWPRTPRWLDGKTLHPGTNKFVVRVYDAYQKKNYTDLSSVVVIVPMNQEQISAD